MTEDQNWRDDSKKPNNYAKFSGLAFQMLATIAAGTYAGVRLDDWFQLKKFPVFTLTLSLGAVGASMYLLIKQVTQR